MGRFEQIDSIQPFLKLQQGDWADVYVAYDASLNKKVVLKRLRSEHEFNPEIVERFGLEAKLMVQLSHSNIVEVLRSEQREGKAYMIAEWVEGSTLQDLGKDRPLPPLISTFILREITQGLGHAHKQNIFHRDIKPANILVSLEGEVKVADFGMASLKEVDTDGEIRGTLGYLAPELLFDGEPSVQSDLFSLGATFFFMLTGKPAFRGASSSEILDAVLHKDPVSLLSAHSKIPHRLISICKRLLEKDPSLRYESCSLVADELDQVLSHVPAYDGCRDLKLFLENPDSYEPLPDWNIPPANTDTTYYQGTGQRHKVKPVYLLAMLVVLVTIGGLALLQSQQKEMSAPVMDNVDSQQALVKPQIPLEVGKLKTVVPSKAEQSDVSSNAAIIKEETSNVHDEILPEVVEDDSSSNEDYVARSDGDLEGSVNILCTPFCDVYINDLQMGSAPPEIVLDMAPGEYQLSLKHPVLPSYTSELLVEAGVADTIRIALKEEVGEVAINILPWAEVYIDSVHYGTVPPEKKASLQPGAHNLLLIHPVLGELETTILVVAGETREYAFNLKELLQ